jgi:leader peptidase (prepilin peptidase)/N-methyltransferase
VLNLRPRQADEDYVNLGLAAAVAAPALALGSFLNVVAARVPRKRSIARPGSACLSCERPIAWYDNVPLVSFALLRGRCRSCGVRIPVLYPAVELVTAVLVVACVVAFGLTPEAAVAAFFCSVLVTVSATDLTHRIIPNVVVLPAAAVCLVAQTLIEPSPEWALAALGAAGFLLVAALVYPAGMGMGDVKLALLMGAALGRTVPVALMAGMLFAVVPSVVLLARHGAKARKMGIPFGPFLALGSLVALFAGDALLDWYLAFL